MLYVSTRIQAPNDGSLAHWVKSTLDGMALGCAPMMRAWGLPPLYRSGVRFQYEPQHGSGLEDFAQPPDTFARGWGDCDDLIIARLAELYAAALPPKFYRSGMRDQSRMLHRLHVQQATGRVAATLAEWKGESLHVLIRLPDKTKEDPAILLGALT